MEKGRTQLPLTKVAENGHAVCRISVPARAKLWPSIALVMLFLVAAIAGCRFPGQARPVLEVGPSPVELEKYNEAVAVYLDADYTSAAEMFNTMREQTTGPIVARMALFGLACSRLMTADDPQSYHDALALWNTWVQCASRDEDRESPLLLAPVIQDKMLFSHIPLEGEAGAEAKEEPNIPRWFMVQASKELKRVKRKLADNQQRIIYRDKRIKALEEEIARLKKKIKAFETIDQKMQKKKNAIPSAN